MTRINTLRTAPLMIVLLGVQATHADNAPATTVVAATNNNPWD